MIPYWTLFTAWLVGAVQFSRADQGRNSVRLFVILAVVTALMIGLRYKVGGDWFAYLGIYALIYFQPLAPALTITDPGYALVNWLAAQVDAGIWLPNLICATLFVAGVGRLSLRQPQPWLAMLVAVPYFIIVVAMGYTRQAAAIGIVAFAISDASERNIVRTMVLISVAALFHKTALLLLPVALGPIALRRLVTAVIGGLAFFGLFVLLLRNQSNDLIVNYAQSNYDSQGAGIRIAMNVVAGTLLLLKRDKLGLSPYQRSYWTLNALLTFISLIALLNLSASSGVDRLALFLIPLQMVTLSRLPQASSSGRSSPLMLISIAVYCFAVQFVWLNFASNAQSWVPYSTTILPAD